MTSLVERTLEQPGTEIRTAPVLGSPVLGSPVMDMIQTALSRGASLEQLQQLIDLKERIEAAEAKKAYVEAMAAFKKEPLIVTKDKVNKQYDSRYTSISNLVNTVNPVLSKYGLSADWEIDQSNGIRVTCVMTHSLGYSKRFPLQVPPDTSGAKNPLQQIKSSLTYAKIATYEAACGIASAEGNLDDDGNGSGGNSQSMPEEEQVSRMDAIEGASTEEELKRFYMAAVDAAEKIGDQASIRAFAASKNKRYRELKGGR
jgi:ERF superfamily